MSLPSECTAFGIATEKPTGSSALAYGSSKTRMYRSYNGELYKDGSRFATAEKLHPTEDVIEFTLDMSAGTLKIAIRGVVQAQEWTEISGTVYPVVAFYSSGKTAELRSLVSTGLATNVNHAASLMAVVEAVTNPRGATAAKPGEVLRPAAVVLAEPADAVRAALVSGLSSFCHGLRDKDDLCSKVVSSAMAALFNSRSVMASLAATPSLAVPAELTAYPQLRPEAFQWQSLVGVLDAVEERAKAICLAPAAGGPVNRLSLFRCTTCFGLKDDDSAKEDVIIGEDSSRNPHLCCSSCAELCHAGHSVKFVEISDKPAVCGETLSSRWPLAVDVAAQKDALLSAGFLAASADSVMRAIASQDVASIAVSCSAFGAALTWSKCDFTNKSLADVLKVEQDKLLPMLQSSEDSLLSVLRDVGEPLLRVITPQKFVELALALLNVQDLIAVEGDAVLMSSATVKQDFVKDFGWIATTPAGSLPSSRTTPGSAVSPPPASSSSATSPTNRASAGAGAAKEDESGAPSLVVMVEAVEVLVLAVLTRLLLLPTRGKPVKLPPGVSTEDVIDAALANGGVRILLKTALCGNTMSDMGRFLASRTLTCLMSPARTTLGLNQPMHTPGRVDAALSLSTLERVLAQSNWPMREAVAFKQSFVSAGVLKLAAAVLCESAGRHAGSLATRSMSQTRFGKLAPLPRAAPALPKGGDDSHVSASGVTSTWSPTAATPSPVHKPATEPHEFIELCESLESLALEALLRWCLQNVPSLAEVPRYLPPITPPLLDQLLKLN